MKEIGWGGWICGFSRMSGVRRFIISEYRKESIGKQKGCDVEGKYACKTAFRYKDAALQWHYKKHIFVISNSSFQTSTTLVRH